MEVFRLKPVKGIIDSVYLDEKSGKTMARLKQATQDNTFPISDFIPALSMSSVIAPGDTLYKPAGKMDLWILGTSGDKSKYDYIGE